MSFAVRIVSSATSAKTFVHNMQLLSKAIFHLQSSLILNPST